ncbi:MAG: DivIVA domain-containing protein, partial [Chroococcidiopsidaceae cyanobacterium CP_BM_ER_R8_30]|nr:DivIVA domain-containing protein [Chroococcidiopsidaceae cyanobacterium CP_BM_ER_R8_30]
MLRDSSSSDPNQNQSNDSSEAAQVRSLDVDIQQELNHLEEIILASPRIPLVGRTLVDEETLLDHLDRVRLQLPAAIEQAKAIVQRQREIFRQAEQNARDIIEAAQAKAAQILNETNITQQAEQEARHLQQQVQLECKAAMEQTMTDIEETRLQAQQELEEMRAAAIAECAEIQRGADEYADNVLQDIEQQLNDM